MYFTLTAATKRWAMVVKQRGRCPDSDVLSLDCGCLAGVRTVSTVSAHLFVFGGVDAAKV